MCIRDRGKTKRCMEDCSKCPEQRMGSVLSLDKFVEDGYEISDSLDMDELVAEKLLLEELSAALNELDPINRRIAELYLSLIHICLKVRERLLHLVSFV